MGVTLDGDDWQIRACLGEEWRWHLVKPWDAPHWIPARVPGSVMDDLQRANELPDLYRGRASRTAEWVSERAWVYRKQVKVPEGGGVVRFDGVDHAATVFANGVEVGTHEGCFAPFEVDLPEGDVLLAVVVHPAPQSEPQVGRTSRVQVHKPRMSYGWDFCPRLVHQGIWRSVTLGATPERFPLVRLENGVGTVEIDGAEALRIDDPVLWWPNGMGAQHLYEIHGFQVGFRTVELRDGYTLVVNGREQRIHGWNWCPIDALYGVPRPEKLRHLLELAAAAGTNVLRVWGGGLLESHAFYDECDRLGILVWQEFSQSSSGFESVPSEDPAFLAAMERDARAVVPRLRRHPSLAIWGGGNELASRSPEQLDDVPLDESRSPVLALLRDVVRELDPGRPWLPTSPSGPRFLNRLDVIAEDPDGQLDVHGPWEHQGLRRHTELYNAGTCRLHSEFGVEGMTNRRVLERLVEPTERWPADRHNPAYEHLGAWWNNAPLVQETFGGMLQDVEEMRRASQWLQYEGLRYAVQANLRRVRCDGTLPWQLNESYPNAWCTSALDHRGDPKPAYWGVRRAYLGAPNASFATWAWGREASVRWSGGPGRVVGLDGVVAGDGGDVPLAAVTTDVFLLDLGSSTRYVMTRAENLSPLLRLPPASVEVTRAPGLLRLVNIGAVAAIGVVIEDARPYEDPGWVTFSDNVLDLLPGEVREIAVTGPEGPLLVEGWNVHA
jgi:beta-mannosidase